MIADHYVGESLQSIQNKCMIKPTSKDLVFDFSATKSSICMKCSNLKKCQIVFLLNVAVTSCAYFQEDFFQFMEPQDNFAVAHESLSL